jgi:hypothetical protein
MLYVDFICIEYTRTETGSDPKHPDPGRNNDELRLLCLAYIEQNFIKLKLKKNFAV